MISLNVVLDYLGIKFEGHHKADNDSLGCAELLLKCLEIDGSILDEMESKYNFHRGKFVHSTFIAHQVNKNKQTKAEVLASLEEHPELAEEDNYFYGKTVCFTGSFMYGTKKELLQKIKDVGGNPTDSVTKKNRSLSSWATRLSCCR